MSTSGRVPRSQGHVQDIMATLRERTRGAHASLEQSLPFMSPSLSIELYRKALARLLGFHAPVEARVRAVAGADAAGLDLERRARAPFLARDLRHLGVGVAHVPAPDTCDATWIATAEDALGCLYVLEGSTLGGQVIGRHLRATLGITPLGGGAYFHGHGPETAEMWRAFGEALRRRVTTVERADLVVRAALTTFDQLRAWLGGEG